MGNNIDTSHENSIREIHTIFRNFQSIDNIHDIVKKRQQEGKISSREIGPLLRSVKAFEGNVVNPGKKELFFPSDKAFEESINNAHIRMIKLTDRLGSDGQKYLAEWNRIFDVYGKIVRMKLSLLKQEISDFKSKQEKDKTRKAEDELKKL